MIRDPVCGLPLSEPKEEFKAEVRGRTYYFCGKYCKRAFLQGKKIAFSLNGIVYSLTKGLLMGDPITP